MIILQPVTPKKKNIAIIPGDGIGPEVIAEAVKAIQASHAAVESTQFDWGADRYLRRHHHSARRLHHAGPGLRCSLPGRARRSTRALEYPRQRNPAGHAFQDGPVRQRSSGEAAGRIALSAEGRETGRRGLRRHPRKHRRRCTSMPAAFSSRGHPTRSRCRKTSTPAKASSA